MGEVIYPRQFVAKPKKKQKRHIFKVGPISKTLNLRVKFKPGQNVLVRHESYFMVKKVLCAKSDKGHVSYQLTDLNWYFEAQLITIEDYRLANSHD